MIMKAVFQGRKTNVRKKKQQCEEDQLTARTDETIAIAEQPAFTIMTTLLLRKQKERLSKSARR